MTELQAMRVQRLKLIALMSLPVIMIVLGYLVFYTGIGMPQGTKNKGTLISPPAQLADIELFDAEGALLSETDWQGKWLVLVPEEDHCGEPCSARVALVQQIQIALGKGQDRIRPVHLRVSDSLVAVGASRPESESSTLVVISAKKGALQQLFQGHDFDPAQPGTVMIVDPRGFIMMYYSADQSGKDILTDLKFLLKYSRIG